MSIWRNLSYKELKNIIDNDKPYKVIASSRIKDERWPLQNREHTNKYFYSEEIDGKTQYVLGYYFSYEDHYISKEQYDKLSDKAKKQYSKDWHNETQYVKCNRALNRFAIIRDDDTIEFCSKYYGQGERFFFQNLSHNMYMIKDVKYGGYFMNEVEGNGYSYYGCALVVNEKVIPMFKGLRVNYITGDIHESSRYTFTRKQVNRKNSKIALADVKQSLKIARTFLGQLTLPELRKQVDEFNKETKPYNTNEEQEEYWKHNLQNNPVESYMVAMNYFRTIPYSRWGETSETPCTPQLNTTDRKILKYIKSTLDGILEEKVYTDKESLKPSDWGTTIRRIS